MSKFDEMTIKIGKHLVPIWTEVLLMVDEFFDESSEGMTDALIEFFVELSHAVVFAVKNLKNMLTWVGKLVGNFISWKKVITFLTSIFTGMFFYGLGMVVTTLYSMAGAVFLLGIASAATVAKYIAMGALFATVVAVIQDLITWLQGGDALFADFWASAWEAMQTFGKKATAFYEQIVGHAEEKIGPKLKRLFRVLIDSSKEFFNYLDESGMLGALDKIAIVVGGYTALTGKDLGIAGKALETYAGGRAGWEALKVLQETTGIDITGGLGLTDKKAPATPGGKNVTINNTVDQRGSTFKGNKEQQEALKNAKQAQDQQLREAGRDAS